MSRLLEKYNKSVIPALMKKFNYSSPMQVPKLKKIVLNAGVGEATQNGKAIEYTEYALGRITGQKPVVTKAKKAIATFKIRRNLPIGVMVTMRSERMYEFLDRLISVALPRVKDFRGVPITGFDGRGSYSMGIKEQIVFPEVNIEKLDKVRGFHVTFVTSAKTDDEGRALLEEIGLPFKKKDQVA
jgi:large subunit ribosomal protein L5